MDCTETKIWPGRPGDGALKALSANDGCEDEWQENAQQYDDLVVGKVQRPKGALHASRSLRLRNGSVA